MKLGCAALAAIVLVVSGCVSSNEVECGDGLSCPSGTTCVALSATENLCATDDQIAACTGLADGASCTLDNVPASTCIAGACIETLCGDGRSDPSESCDDGNTISGDGCSSDCRSLETCNNGIVDPLRYVDGVPTTNEECDDGNFTSGDGCSSTCRRESLRWAELAAPPPSLSAYSLAYDSARRRIVMFGGRTVINSGAHYEKALYEWDGIAWGRIPSVGGPQQRVYASMAYDAARHRVVLFGGDSGSDTFPFHDTWEWDGETWTQRFPTTSPPGRTGATMVYDAARKKIVLFGGHRGADASGPEADLDDTWEWDGTEWAANTSATKPGPRRQAVMAYDPVRSVIVLAGGMAGTYPPPPASGLMTPQTDTWELDATGWHDKGATVPSSPTWFGQGESLASMAYDQAGSRMLLLMRPTATTASVSTLSYSGGSWSAVAGAVPSARIAFSLVSDPIRGGLFLYGGEDSSTNSHYADTWTWSGSAWIKQTIVPPANVVWGSRGTSPETGVTWLFGGRVTTNNVQSPVNTLYRFNGTSWELVTTTGTPPSPRVAAQTAYDYKRHRLVVFGGNDNESATYGDTFELDGTTWLPQTPADQPPARFGGTMSYDPVRERVVLFGGGLDISTAFGDTWEWDGTNWTEVTGPGPTARFAPAMTFDPALGKSVLTGGFDANTNTLYRDTWTFDGTWTKVEDVAPYAPRLLEDVAYDTVAGHLAFMGGLGAGGTPLVDTWVWNGAWSEFGADAAPDPRTLHVTFSAPQGAGVCVFGGSTDVDSGGTQYNDTWRLRYQSEEPHEMCAIPIDNDGDGKVGCDDPDCAASCATCGDGICSAQENCRICAADCTCTAVCGDNFCDTGETAASCPGDCTP